MKRVLHVQVSGEPTFEEMKTIGETFASALGGDEQKVLTTADNVQAYNIEVTDETPISGIVVAAAISVDLIALVAHEVNRGYCEAIGDPVPAAWAEATEAHRKSMILGVVSKLRYNSTPQQQHEAWCQSKLGQGWVYGSVKDEEAKTHPCLVDYNDLPDAQRVKDYLFGAVVTALAPKLPRPSPIVRDIEALSDITIENRAARAWHPGLKFSQLQNGMIFRFPGDPQVLRAISDLYVNYEGANATLTVDVEVARDENPHPWQSLLENIIDPSVVEPEAPVPNAETVAAMEEAQAMEGEARFDNVDDLIEHLDANAKQKPQE